jgi:glycerophosphoryl diester phosphodiesterase
VRPRPPVLVSAHRFGAGDDASQENSRAALDASLALGVDYVEFDVQRCVDGTFVVSHSAWVQLGQDRVRISELTLPQLRVLRPDTLRYVEVLDALVGRAKAHIDLKFISPDDRYDDAPSTYEAEAARLAVERLGEAELIVTTLDDKAVRAVRDWADRAGVELLVGLSLGRSVRGLPWHEQLRVRVSELRPQLRLRESRANLVVAKHTIARLGVAALARRRRLPLLVWTIDTDKSLRYWMKPGRAWLVTSNYPAAALRTRRTWTKDRGRLAS